MVTVFRARATRRSGRVSSGSTSSVAQQLAARLVADAGIGPDDRVVDLGAGTGVLTAALAATGAVGPRGRARPALAARLAQRFAAAPNVTVLHADVRDVSAAPHSVPRRGEPAVRRAPRRSSAGSSTIPAAAWCGPTSWCSGRSPGTAPG